MSRARSGEPRGWRHREDRHRWARPHRWLAGPRASRRARRHGVRHRRARAFGCEGRRHTDRIPPRGPSARGRGAGGDPDLRAVAGAQAEPLVAAAGPGFRASTRLADTPADLATELLFGNAADSRAAIGSIIEGLTQLRDALERGDRDYARSFLQTARSVRRELG